MLCWHSWWRRATASPWPRCAGKASCSKETLYNWFGDRDGLLAATVRWQASKVRLPSPERCDLDRQALSVLLADFAESWLTVLTGEVSIALNSLAVAHAKSAKSALGQTVLDNGRFAIGRRVKPVLDMAREAGLSALMIPRRHSVPFSDWWCAMCRSARCWATGRCPNRNRSAARPRPRHDSFSRFTA
jgi:AcrR family transcriptional regulator